MSFIPFYLTLMVQEFLVVQLIFYWVNIILAHAAHAHEWVFTHVCTDKATRGWPVLWTSSPASLHVRGSVLHSLPSSPSLLLLSSQRQQETAQRLPLLWAFSFITPSPVQRLSMGHLAWPVHLYRCWWIETLSWLLFLSFACPVGGVHNEEKNKTKHKWLLSLSFLQLFFLCFLKLVKHCLRYNLIL